MLKVTLPINKKPLISTYTSYGCLFSILNDEMWPWIYNNFIQIRYAHDWGMFAFDSHHLLLQNCPGISFYELPRELITLKWNKSIKRLIIESIDLGYYLFLYVDRFYISESNYNNKSHFPHEIFIYGYDREKETVLLGDNLQSGHFYTTEVPFDEIEKGYWGIESDYSFLEQIRLLKVHKEFECKIDLEKIKVSLENYLQSKKTFDLVVIQEYDFGFQAIERLFTDISRASASNEKLDKRVFHLLYEHKLLMEKRLGYLMENGYITFDNPLLEFSVRLKNDYLILRNLVLKHNIQSNTLLLNRISSKLRENIINEKIFISRLLEKIDPFRPTFVIKK